MVHSESALDLDARKCSRYYGWTWHGDIIIAVLCLLFKGELHYAFGTYPISAIATSSGAAAVYDQEGSSQGRIGMVVEAAITAGALLSAYIEEQSLEHEVEWPSALGYFTRGEIAMMSVFAGKPFVNLSSVVFATDFSEGSENAGLYAARIAANLSAKLLVAHAFTLSQAALEVEICDRKVSQQRMDLNGLLSKEAHRLGAGQGNAIPTLLEGSPKETITQLADRNAPSMIVLGTHGGSSLERGIIGSTAEKILRSTPWPALTVGPTVPPLSSNSHPFKRILFATDYTPEAALAAAFVVRFAELFGAGIDILNVVQDSASDNPTLLAKSRSRFFSIVDGLVPRHAQAFCDPNTFVAIGSAHDRIVEQVRDRSNDLLVLSIRNASHLRMEMRTSGVFRIIVDADCPVLTIRR
jgi:nucleotide-binding universal stress UspA family protein